MFLMQRQATTFHEPNDEDVRRELIDDLLSFCLEFDRPYREKELEIDCRLSNAFGRPCVRHNLDDEFPSSSPRAHAPLSDRIGELEIEIRWVVVRVLPAVGEAVDLITPWAPELHAQLDAPERHRLAAQIFEKAGITDRLMTLEERYPHVVGND